MILKNNKVNMRGCILVPWTYGHESCGEKFYRTYIIVTRLSGAKDIIPIVISECLIDPDYTYMDHWTEIKGEFHSWNYWDGEKGRCSLSVFVQEISYEDTAGELNKAELTGYICKPPIRRTTPKGRTICDVMLAVNRSYGKSDYIPCILWGRNAEYVSNLSVGTKVNLSGRIQSREYQKQVDGEIKTRVAYEFSASRVEVL